MIPFVYVTSASFSGSTLLTFLLNAHPRIATIGELKGDDMDVAKYRCSCGAPIGQCGFWGEIVTRLRRCGVGFDVSDKWTQCGFRVPNAPLTNRLLGHRVRGPVFEAIRDAYAALSPKCRRSLPEIRKRLVLFVQTVLDITGRSIFVDASKDPIRLKHILRIPEFSTKVVSIVRDGRGVMNSHMKREKLSSESAAREWAVAQEEIRLVLRRMRSENALRIRYEDLCANPTSVLARIFEFLGVPAEEMVSDFREVPHHILGNPMRFQQTSEIRVDTKWQLELRADELEVFERTAGALNREFGYAAAAS